LRSVISCFEGENAMKDRPVISVVKYFGCLLTLALLSGFGCSVSPDVNIHARYAELRPEAIHVLPVRNGTLRPDLDKYRLNSRLQESVVGGSEVNVLALFRHKFQQTVRQRGFELRDDSGGDGVGTMEVVIEEWRDAPAFGASDIVVRYRVELVLPQSGEILYSTTVTYRMESRGSSIRKLTPVELRRDIRKTVRAALDRLPPLE
jgi:hypothetical protein